MALQVYHGLRMYMGLGSAAAKSVHAQTLHLPSGGP